MGKLKEFQIRLADNKSVYFPGESLAGDLLVRLDRPMDVRGIKISFRGRAFVHWTERKRRGTGKNARTVTVHYRNEQKLFFHSVQVFGKDAGDRRESISQGEHVFPFAYQLPAPLPTSYEDHTGHIRYDITATIEKPWKFNKKTIRTITILDTVDLNNVHNAMNPAIGTETKYLCCCCCKSGPIKAEFQSDRSAYVPGEFVTINATLKNKSKSKVKATSASLMQKVSYHATRKTKVNWKNIAQITGKECPGGKTITWTNERIQIPPVPPTETTHCKVLDIEYYLMFQGHLRLCAVDLREYEKIVIGTVPLRTLSMYQNDGDRRETLPSAPDPQSLLPSTVINEPESQSSIPAAAPPRAMFKASPDGMVNLASEDDDGKTIGDVIFNPQYTFYDWSQSAFTY